jgi:salicylate hydroxylase
VSKELELESGLNICCILLPEETMKSNPDVYHLMERHDMWLGPGRVVVATSARRGDSRVYMIEFCFEGDVSISGASNKLIDIQTIKERFEDFDPIIHKVLALVETGWLWRIAKVPPHIPWTNDQGNIVLIGDSAHALLPHTAQVISSTFISAGMT